jgi:hypothetical protein
MPAWRRRIAGGIIAAVLILGALAGFILRDAEERFSANSATEGGSSAEVGGETAEVAGTWISSRGGRSAGNPGTGASGTEVLGGSYLAGGAGTSGATASGSGGQGQGPPDHVKSFTIRGDVETLYPGATLDLVVTITNPQQFAIEVTEIDVVTKTDPSHTGCSASSYVDGSSFEGSIVVARKGSTIRSGILSVSMDHAAPDACQGARFPLEFHGRAVKA